MEKIKVEQNHDKYLPLLIQELRDFCIFFLTIDGRIATWSGGCKHIKEYKKEEILGCHYRILFPERFQKEGKPEKEIETAIKKGKFEDYNWRVKKSGEEFWAHVILLALYDDAKNLLGFAKITEDRTKEYNDEKKLKELNRQLDEFAFTVSHDLKAPLRGIKTISDILIEETAHCLKKEQKDLLKLLTDSVKKMSLQVDSILKYAQTSSDQHQKEKVDLNELIKEVIKFIHPGEKVKIKVSGKLPTLHIAPTPFFQVFQNLIDNAVKYNESDPVVIKINARKEGNKWHFIIADNGLGIDEKHFEKIFKVFQKIPGKGEKESTGVGLAIVHKVITSNGGEIWVESELGKGSKFHFTIIE